MIEIKSIIQQFEATSRAFVAELVQNAGMKISADNIARVLTVIPRQGLLATGTRYAFHGIGCRFERPDGTVVDVDFGPVPNQIGFEEHRLLEFFKSLTVSEAFECTDLRRDLDAMRQSGDLQLLDLPAWRHLFFFPDKESE